MIKGPLRKALDGMTDKCLEDYIRSFTKKSLEAALILYAQTSVLDEIEALLKERRKK